MSHQLALPLPHAAPYADFIADASNAAALRWLAHPDVWPQRRLALEGPPGTGKTHLLHIMAARHGWALLTGPALRGLPAIPARGAVVDDADLLPEPAALLHLMNASAEAGLPLLLAAPTAPSRWRVPLPDLASRLAATAVASLDEATDPLLDALFAKHLAERQLQLDPALAALVRRPLPRSAAAVAEAVCRLDRASLAAGRLTRAVALAAIAPMLGDDPSVTDALAPLPSGPALL